MEQPDRLLLRVPEAAELLGVSRSRAYELVYSGEIPAIRLGKSLRIPLQALREWVTRSLVESSR
jgi:excisionase family DNA binding protein